MVTVPADTIVTSPVPESTVATAVLSELYVTAPPLPPVADCVNDPSPKVFVTSLPALNAVKAPPTMAVAADFTGVPVVGVPVAATGVTLNAIALPSSATTNVYEVPVSPVIFEPSRYHSYAEVPSLSPFASVYV